MTKSEYVDWYVKMLAVGGRRDPFDIRAELERDYVAVPSDGYKNGFPNWKMVPKTETN